MHHSRLTEWGLLLPSADSKHDDNQMSAWSSNADVFFLVMNACITIALNTTTDDAEAERNDQNNF